MPSMTDERRNIILAALRPAFDKIMPSILQDFTPGSSTCRRSFAVDVGERLWTFDELDEVLVRHQLARGAIIKQVHLSQTSRTMIVITLYAGPAHGETESKWNDAIREALVALGFNQAVAGGFRNGRVKSLDGSRGYVGDGSTYGGWAGSAIADPLMMTEVVSHPDDKDASEKVQGELNNTGVKAVYRIDLDTQEGRDGTATFSIKGRLFVQGTQIDQHGLVPRELGRKHNFDVQVPEQEAIKMHNYVKQLFAAPRQQPPPALPLSPATRVVSTTIVLPLAYLVLHDNQGEATINVTNTIVFALARLYQERLLQQQKKAAKRAERDADLDNETAGRPQATPHAQRRKEDLDGSYVPVGQTGSSQDSTVVTRSTFAAALASADGSGGTGGEPATGSSSQGDSGRGERREGRGGRGGGGGRGGRGGGRGGRGSGTNARSRSRAGRRGSSGSGGGGVAAAAE